MSLIIGHTTYESTWIWVRGSKKARHLNVELHGLFDEGERLVEGVKEEPVVVSKERDYTAVVRFESGLVPDEPYDVVLRNTNGARLTGRLRTFAKPGKPESFHFLHGSCNLPVDRMTALGSAAAGLVGAAATAKAFELPVSRWDAKTAPPHLRWLAWPMIRGVAAKILRFAAYTPGAAMYLTRFEQPGPLLPSPFEPVLNNVLGDQGTGETSEHQGATDADEPVRPAFMIHCGDQIYYDVDFPAPTGGEEDYRRNYRQSWLKDEHAARLLRSFPHYMTLDDHEIVDNFGTDADAADDERKLRGPALRVYEEYVASRQPHVSERPESLYYHFEHGNTSFFVLDTRSERSAKDGRMVGAEQLGALVSWLNCTDYDLRFIVSSVPFVAQYRPPGLDRNGERRGGGRADKWCGDAWKEQRNDIIRAIAAAEVDRLVFLVGDMHCTYHARMLIGDRRKRITIHELAGGPLNQLQFAKRDDFYARYVDEVRIPRAAKDEEHRRVPPEALSVDNQKGDYDVLPWTSTLESFHGAAPSVLEISVSTPRFSKSESPRCCEPELPLEVRWTALRTSPARGRQERPVNFPSPVDPHDLCGRIRFHRRLEEDA